MAGMLTTHVLDIMHGCPAANMRIQLWRIDRMETSSTPTAIDRMETSSTPTAIDRMETSSTPTAIDRVETSSTPTAIDWMETSSIPTASTKQWQLLKTVYTTDNGRTISPLLQGKEFVIGRYELVFGVKAYFTALGVVLPEPAFLDDVPIRFAIAKTDEHYHVPLLVSPWAYSTYRGS